MANVSSSNGLEKRPKLRLPGFDEPWQSTLLSSVFTKNTKKNTDGQITNVICNSAKQGLIPQREYFDKDIANSDNTSGYYIIEENDFVYNPRKSADAPYGPISRYKYAEAGIVSPLYLCFRAKKEINPSFFEWYFRSSAWHRYVYMSGDSGARHDRVSIKDDTFFAMPINLPSAHEQEHIASFLERIDQRIEKQRALVEFLKKYKRGLLRTVFSEKGSHSLLHDAVSHRIDEVCDVLSGKRIPKGETFSPRPTEYRYITVSDMGEKYISSDTLQFITSHTEKQITRYKVRNGDIIISVAGTLGKLNIITPDLDGVNLTENCDRFTNFRGINPEYLYHVLSSDLIQSQIEASKTKNGQPKLALERIRNFVVPVPHQIRQEQFVGVMNSIDKYIASQQAVLDRCCKARAGLLQQLFI